MQRLIASGMLMLWSSFVQASEATVAVASVDDANRVVAAAGKSAAVMTVARKAFKEDENRRCAFIGRNGSFTVIGATGTAAYRLGNERYIADLVSAGEDGYWWFYSPTANGDPSTTMWAFARFPRCGRHTVLRFSNGAWQTFGQTEAWGRGLGSSGGVASAVGNPTNLELLNKLRDIEDKLRVIQPGNQPSLLDLQNQIKAKP